MYAGVTGVVYFYSLVVTFGFQYKSNCNQLNNSSSFKVSKTIFSYSLYRAQEKFLKEMHEEVRGVPEVHK